MVLGVMVTPALPHHSFAMYDQTTTRIMTGKLTRYVPGANHAQLIFELLDETGKPVRQNGKVVQWGVETGSAASLARQGVTTKTFPEGTIFTVTLHPLRDGRTFGAISGSLISCGATMPAGGCNEKTGQVLIARANPDAQ
jgi:hypothetical protein